MSRQMEAQNAENHFDVTCKVFNNDLLLELILDLALFKRKSLCRDTLCSLRLVKKGWLETVNKLLRRRHEPLFKILLKSNSEFGCLDQFITVLTISSQAALSNPTFSLKIKQEYFRSGNQQSLSRCLNEFALGLVALELYISIREHSISNWFPSFHCKNLRSLTLNIVGLRTLVRFADYNITLKHGLETTQFMQALLNGAPSLSNFVLPPSDPLPCVPPNFRYLSLPSTLTKLELSCEMSTTDMEILINNSLPKLMSLTIPVSEDSYSEGSLFRVLDKFRCTLKELKIKGISDNFYPTTNRKTVLRLPTMEKLTKFLNDSIHCQLEADQIFLEQYLPNLLVLQLCYQTVAMFKRWTENSKFVRVKFLTIGLIEDEGNKPLSLNLETMRTLDMTFPSVMRLDLAIGDVGEEDDIICGFRYLFKQLTRLTFLRIRFTSGGRMSITNSDFWDPLLIGTTREIVQELQTKLGTRKEVQHCDLKTDSSITNLKELKTLVLENDCCESDIGSTKRRHNYRFSDITFHYALFKMDSLRILKLHGGFLVSDEIIQQWKAVGRTFIGS